MLRPADIILTSPTGIIPWFMRLFQSDPVNWGHVAIVESPGYVIESRGMVCRKVASIFLSEHNKYKILRLKYLSTEDAKKIVGLIITKIGLRYGVKRLILQIFDHITFSNFFTNRWYNVDDQVCSSLVAWGFQEVINFRFNGVDWKSCDPDDIEDESEINPDIVIVDESS